MRRILHGGSRSCALVSSPQSRRIPDAGSSFKAEVDSVAIGPDGKYAVVAADDGPYAALLQIKGPEPGQEPTFPAGQIQALACSQTRETVISVEQWKRFSLLNPSALPADGPMAGPAGRPTEQSGRAATATS